MTTMEDFTICVRITATPKGVFLRGGKSRPSPKQYRVQKDLDGAELRPIPDKSIAEAAEVAAMELVHHMYEDGVSR